MKNRIIIIPLIVLLLFVPLPTSLNDGGTVAWSAFTYKIVSWNRIEDTGRYYINTSVYWFPDNFKSIDELWNMEMQDS